MSARPGERYRFVYPNEPKFDRDLTVVSITGDSPDDLVFWDDHTHTKQKHMDNIERIKEVE